MAKAIWDGVVVAESDRFVEIEGNVYFPPDALKREYFVDSTTTTVCGWKGTANYYSLKAGDRIKPDAAWVYHTPQDAAREIRDHVAFYQNKGLRVEK